MKKILTILAIMFTTISTTQCHKSESPSSFTTTFTGGFANTMNGELSLRIKNLYIGAGAGVMIDNQIQTQNSIEYTRNDHAYFLNLGYQKDNIFFGTRIGNQTIVHITGVVNGIQQSIPDENKFMIGGLIGYSVTPRIRFNLGYDTFNKTNIGIAFGL